VQVNVEYLLPRHRAIGQEEIDSFTPKAASPQRSRYALPHLENVRPYLCIELRQAGSVRDGHDQYVPRIDGLNIQKSTAHVIPENDTRRQFPRQDATEHTITHQYLLSNWSLAFFTIAQKD
jgi:hypothetical protein